MFRTSLASATVTSSVPLAAVANSDGESRVWVVGRFRRIRPVPVILGRTSPDRVEVVQGLMAGQEICVNAEPDFAGGMRVVVVSPERATAARSKTHALMNTLKTRKKSP